MFILWEAIRKWAEEEEENVPIILKRIDVDQMKDLDWSWQFEEEQTVWTV